MNDKQIQNFTEYANTEGEVTLARNTWHDVLALLARNKLLENECAQVAEWIEAVREENTKLRAVAEAAKVYKEQVLRVYHRKEFEPDPFYFDAAEIALGNTLAALDQQSPADEGETGRASESDEGGAE